jgi:ATP-dependent Clp protease ATP-binding subunit ClpA
MLEHLTENARASVVLAECEARELGSDDIGAEHLLLALASSEAGTAGRVLAEAGIDEAAVRAALAARARVGPFDRDDAEALRTVGIDLELVLARLGDQARSEPLPRSNSRRGRLRFSRTARKSLQLAVREAVWLRSREIGSEHLLLGLLRCDDPAVTSLVTGLGAEPDAVRTSVLQRLGTAV